MRDLAFLDLETTGLDPTRHEIIEAAVVRVDGRTLRELDSVSVRIAPAHIERADPEALQVNGFDPSTWGGGALEEALLAVEPLLEGANVAGCSVARFDIPFLMAAYDLLCWARPKLGKHQLNIESLCWALLARGQVKSLSLGALCDFHGVSNEGAHGALVDCRRALEVARRVLLAQPAGAQISEAALRWLGGCDTGTSSLTIFEVMTGHPQSSARGHSNPWDPDDFGRCYRLLKIVPEWRGRLAEVAHRFPRWAPFVAHWSEMERLYEEEIPNHLGRAPKLWKLMQQLSGQEPVDGPVVTLEVFHA